MILIWGARDDEAVSAVLASLAPLNEEVIVISPGTLALATSDPIDGPCETDHLRLPGGDLDLARVDAAYLRPWTPRRGVDDTPTFSKVIQQLTEWADVSDALIMNRPFAARSNESKPYQTELLRRSGFLIPRTLLTTERSAALRFAGEHQRVIFKSISNVRSRVRSVDLRELRALLDERDIAYCPTQFQEYIVGMEVRVHVVGSEVYACEVVSAAVDYRYGDLDGHSVIMRPIELGPEIEDRCKEATKALGLAYSGLDLRRDLHGRWYCFEANTSPGFTYFQRLGRLPISDGIARMLAHGHRTALI